MSKKDAEEELARLHKEQAEMQRRKEEQRLEIEENLVRMEDLRKRRYDPDS